MSWRKIFKGYDGVFGFFFFFFKFPPASLDVIYEKPLKADGSWGLKGLAQNGKPINDHFLLS